jgi:drug/metabolite transporter (DMT)-like permease
MFIVMFYVIGISTQKAGVAVTTVAVKMSVIFPIAFSIWYDAIDKLTLLKSIGIAMAVVSVLLTVHQKSSAKIDWRAILLPAFIFIGMGVVDSFVKYSQSEYITNDLTPIFSTLVFSSALIAGILILPFNRQAARSLQSFKTILLGIILGLVNFGSMYFLILALNHVDTSTGKQAMGSVVFGINNIGIVALSVIVGFLAFKERPSPINWVGIAISGIAILILFYS